MPANPAQEDDVSGLGRLERRVADLERENAALRDRIARQIGDEAFAASLFVLAPAFMATMRGPEHVFELSNPQYDQLVGGREIVGKTVREALPEIEGQGFYEKLDEVYATGKPFSGNGIPVLVRHEKGGALEERFLSFVYQPLTEADGTVSGVFVHGVDITEQVRTAQELREAGRKKDDFLAMLGHELRNPLAPIRNAVQILRQAGHDEPILEKARDMIERQVSHMTRLVDDLLDVSRISRGKILLHRERLDLTTLVRDTVEDHRRDLEGGGLTLDLGLPAKPLWVEGDATRLAQALENLLSNAGKFTDPGGRVRVELKTGVGRESAEIVVQDTGIGIEPEMLENLFETFSQADRTPARSRGGLGLGLALVKGLMDLHGGEVEAVSEGLGRGSRFALRLPLAAAQEDPGEEAAPPARANGSRRVLIVEDNADAAESLQMLLELSGFEVTTAADGMSGLETTRRFHPDVVLCDIGLPGGLDGYGVARELRADSTLHSVRLIALTGYGQAEDQRRAYAEGFDLHLTKPVDPVLLKDLLARP